MAAPAISASTRYINPGTTRLLWVPTISNKSAPTRSELNAGTDLSSEVADVSGWLVSGEAVETPDLATRFTSNIPGRTSAEDSSITLYASNDGVDARETMPRDTAGYIVWMDGGDVAGRLMDVYPVRVLSVGKERSVGSEAARVTIQFSITSEPAENVEIPA